MALALINERTRAPIATEVELASTRATRRRGLLGRDSLSPSSALMLTPCVAVHTAFMRFAIDVVFLDKELRVVHVEHSVPPWRAVRGKGAKMVVELAAGECSRLDVEIGDPLTLIPSAQGAAMPRRHLRPVEEARSQ